MKTQILNRYTGKVMLESGTLSLRKLVLENKADLSGADLYGADLSGADLSDADLSDADLSGADLSGADLSGADLSWANLSWANLSGADLSWANLSWANLYGANLSWADLSGADLSGADLSGADLSDTTMPGFKDRPAPTSISEAAALTKEWLVEGHWIQGEWIKTPTSAYNGDCLACLHGAAAYCGVEYGPALSAKLKELGFDEGWNDFDGRTITDIAAALDQVIAEVTVCQSN